MIPKNIRGIEPAQIEHKIGQLLETIITTETNKNEELVNTPILMLSGGGWRIFHIIDCPVEIAQDFLTIKFILLKNITAPLHRFWKFESETENKIIYITDTYANVTTYSIDFLHHNTIYISKINNYFLPNIFYINILENCNFYHNNYIPIEKDEFFYILQRNLTKNKNIENSKIKHKIIFQNETLF